MIKQITFIKIVAGVVMMLGAQNNCQVDMQWFMSWSLTWQKLCFLVVIVVNLPRAVHFVLGVHVMVIIIK